MTGPPPWGRVALRMGLRLAVILGIAVGVSLLLDWAMYMTDHLPTAQAGRMRLLLIAGALLIYTVLMATPFVPGIEIGLALLMLRGPDIAPLVFLATVMGLTLAYLVGCRLPLTVIRRFFFDLRMRRVVAMIDQVAPLGPEARLAALSARLPSWADLPVRRLRYLVLALVLNLPGNAVLGGGGGLALMAGLSGLFRPLPTLITIALAVAPVPLILWVWGDTVMLNWLPVPH